MSYTIFGAYPKYMLFETDEEGVSSRGGLPPLNYMKSSFEKQTINPDMPQSCLLYVYPNYYVFISRWSHWRPSICPTTPKISHPRSNPELYLGSRWRRCAPHILPHAGRLVCQSFGQKMTVWKNQFPLVIIESHGDTVRAGVCCHLTAIIFEMNTLCILTGHCCCKHPHSHLCLS